MSEKKFSREEIVKKVNEVIADRLYVDESIIKEDTLLEKELNADSLDALQIVMDIERVFDIKITDDKISPVFNGTAGYLYGLVEELV